MARIIDRDRGYKKLYNALKKVLGEIEITLGFHSDIDGEVLKVASINEFGGPNDDPPSRSMIAGWSDSNEGKNLGLLKKASAQVVKGKDPKQAIKQVAAIMVGDIQQRIADGIPPPNADSTIAQKGRDSPLINSGQMRSMVGAKVDGEKVT